MIALFPAFSLANHVETPVRATLADGQVLMGQVRTRILRLVTGAGLVEVPLADVGEVRPAEGRQLGTSEGQVNLWLRNGSELRGTWSDPELAMGIEVGGEKVGVNLPMGDLTRFQLQGAVAWPNAPVYRLQTTWGDDVLIDPARTHLELENQLGSFSPSLAECRSAAPVGDPDGDWRIELNTGTVLVGELHGDAITVALPMGPKSYTVPLTAFQSLKLQSWTPPTPPPTRPFPTDPRLDSLSRYGAGGEAGTQDYAEATAQPVYTEEAAPARGRPTGPRKTAGRAAPAAAPQGQWFDAAPVDAAKDQAARDDEPASR